MTDSNLDNMLDDLGIAAPQETVAVAESHTEPEATMPDMPASTSTDGGKPLYAEINPELKTNIEVTDCETVKSVTVYPAGYTVVKLNSGRKSNSFFVYEDQWDEFTALVRSERWDELKSQLKAGGFRNRGQ